MIKATDAAQGGLCDELTVTDPAQPRWAEGGNPAERADPNESFERESSNPKSSTPLLSLEEKRQILARIVRTDALDCFDDTGAFDIALAKRVLPPGAIRHIDVDETIRVDAEGEPVTQRRIRLRLVDPLSALRLDDIFERRQNPAPVPANTKMGERKIFNLLREKTMALDDARQSIDDLKEALAEANDHELQLTQELDEKQCQPGTPAGRFERSDKDSLGLSEGCRRGPASTETTEKQPARVSRRGESTDSLAPSHPTPDPAPQSDTGCQSVKAKPPGSFQAASRTLEGVTGKNLKKPAAPSIDYEMEHMRNTSGILGFADWLRINRPAEWAKHQSLRHSTKPPATQHQKTAAGPRIGVPARSPP